MRLERSFLVSLRGLLALVGLAIGFAVLSGCASEGSTSGQQQKTPVNTHARDQGSVPSSWVDFTKDPRHQTGPTYPLYNGKGTV
jgi:hypothetical protein